MEPKVKEKLTFLSLVLQCEKKEINVVFDFLYVHKMSLFLNFLLLGTHSLLLIGRS